MLKRIHITKYESLLLFDSNFVEKTPTRMIETMTAKIFIKIYVFNSLSGVILEILSENKNASIFAPDGIKSGITETVCFPFVRKEIINMQKIIPKITRLSINTLIPLLNFHYLNASLNIFSALSGLSQTAKKAKSPFIVTTALLSFSYSKGA